MKIKGRVKGNRLNTVNKHFGDWFLLHLLMKNIDRRTFQEIINKLCDDRDKNRSYVLRRNLTNISEDQDHENNPDRPNKVNGENEENTDENDRFFLPGNRKQRKLAVNFESDR